MSDKNDKTVPAEADDYKEDDKQRKSGNERRVEHDPLVKEAKSKPGEVPNRDEDEFSDDGRKKPDIEEQLRNEAEKATDKN